MIFIASLLIWFEISGPPGQILSRDQDCAVTTHGLEIAQFTVIQISVHVVDQELAGMMGPEATAITS